MSHCQLKNVLSTITGCGWLDEKGKIVRRLSEKPKVLTITHLGSYNVRKAFRVRDLAV